MLGIYGHIVHYIYIFTTMGSFALESALRHKNNIVRRATHNKKHLLSNQCLSPDKTQKPLTVSDEGLCLSVISVSSDLVTSIS
jgi:hypothetical protein